MLAFHHWQSRMQLTDHMTVLLLTTGSPTCKLTCLMFVGIFMTGSVACNLTALLQVAPQLGQLGVQGSLLGASSLTALAALSGLHCLSLSISPNSPHTLIAITCLSHLTALQVGTTLDACRHCTVSVEMVDMGPNKMPHQCQWCIL